MRFQARFFRCCVAQARRSSTKTCTFLAARSGDGALKPPSSDPLLELSLTHLRLYDGIGLLTLPEEGAARRPLLAGSRLPLGCYWGSNGLWLRLKRPARTTASQRLRSAAGGSQLHGSHSNAAIELP